MASNPIVLVHGYSDDGSSFDVWRDILRDRGYDVAAIHACSYRSLTNEVTIRDIAEGFDRALKLQAGLDADQPFDAIVHSTGMLVMRCWLTAYAGRRGRLKHLLALAPATFGSPLAHKGRSWLGAVFKGNRERGPDFLEAGDRILDGLEMGSRFTWDLAHEDLLGAEPFYGPTRRTPYVFVFCGNRSYGGLRQLIAEPGTDGTVRWASCPLNTRKIQLDLTTDAGSTEQERVSVADWKNVDIPLVAIDGKNHGTILSDPGETLIELATSALAVDSAPKLAAWIEHALSATAIARAKMDEWQQFVIRVVDERGDPVPDYNVQLFTRGESGGSEDVRNFDVDVHTYRGDPSLRCFHVRLADLDYKRLTNLWIRVMASSGTRLVGYQGCGSERGRAQPADEISEGKWDGELDISKLVDDKGTKFFYPFTTTLVELKLNREPLPFGGKNEVCWF